MKLFHCAACGKLSHSSGFEAETADGEPVPVGPDCWRQIVASGTAGFDPPSGRDALWPLGTWAAAMDDGEKEDLAREARDW